MKLKWGERRDGKLLRDIDSMHFIMPLMYPNRCDNEAFISERIDLTNVMKYLEKKNADGPAYKYNFFQVMVTAVLKTIMLRPQLNRFIANGNLYERYAVTAAFTVKKIFSDEGEEALAVIHACETDNIDSIHDEIYRQVSYVRNEGKDKSTESMDILQRTPLPLKKVLGAGARFLDRRGWMPQAVIETDPFQSSVVLANLGSIKLKSGYHHLTNWGTCSVICLIGEVKETPVFRSDGSVEMKPTVDLGITLDERLADGYYYSKTVRLLKHLLENPELLELPLNEETEY